MKNVSSTFLTKLIKMIPTNAMVISLVFIATKCSHLQVLMNFSNGNVSSQEQSNTFRV